MEERLTLSSFPLVARSYSFRAYRFPDPDKLYVYICDRNGQEVAAKFPEYQQRGLTALFFYLEAIRDRLHGI